MQKLFMGILSALLLVSLSTAAIAAQTVTEENGSGQIDVLAKAVYVSPENMYQATVSEGEASITTQNGTTVSVAADKAALEGLTLNVTEIVSGDPEACDYISDAMDGPGKDFVAYDIFFTDKDGNRLDPTGEMTVSITTPDGYTSPQVYYIGADGTKKAIESKQSEENTVFNANDSGYYVLAGKANGGGETDPTKPGNPESPQTGDTSNIVLWFMLLLTSGIALTILGITGNRRKTDAK